MLAPGFDRLDDVPRYFGKYRGKVLSNEDPEKRGRLQVTVPDVPGVEKLWALPNVPYAGKSVGHYMIPPQAAAVWVEFEGGRLEQPIWAGCFWTEGEAPSDLVPAKKLIKTEDHELLLDDTKDEGGFSLTIGKPAVKNQMTIIGKDKSLTIKVDPTATITLTDQDITISFDPATVTLKKDELSAELSPAKLLLKTDALTGELSPAKLSLKSDGAELSLSSSKTQVAAEGVTLQAGAAKVSVTGAAIKASGAAAVQLL